MLLSDMLYCGAILLLCLLIIFGYLILIKAIWKTTHEAIICYRNRCLTCPIAKRNGRCYRDEPVSFSDVALGISILIALILPPIAFILELLGL